MNLSHGLQTNSFVMYIKSQLQCRGPAGFDVEAINTVTGVEHRDLFLNHLALLEHLGLLGQLF